MRAVLDANVLIAALLSRAGAPAQLVRRWLEGEFELIVSEKLLAELMRALAYPKLRKRITSDEAAEFVALLAASALCADDPFDPARRSSDPDDDYLLALAEAARSVLVSGDGHLLAISNLPVQTPRAFVEVLDAR